MNRKNLSGLYEKLKRAQQQRRSANQRAKQSKSKVTIFGLLALLGLGGTLFAFKDKLFKGATKK